MFHCFVPFFSIQQPTAESSQGSCRRVCEGGLQSIREVMFRDDGAPFGPTHEAIVDAPAVENLSVGPEDNCLRSNRGAGSFREDQVRVRQQARGAID